MNNIPHVVDTGASVIPKKTLTDDEILDLINYVAERPTDEDLYDFARAILKKVQSD
jgi:hypothetical protein